MKKTDYPYFLPKSNSRQVRLTKDQLNYILPAFNRCRRVSGNSIDGIVLCGDLVSGSRLSFMEFIKRFRYSDLDISNLERASEVLTLVEENKEIENELNR